MAEPAAASGAPPRVLLALSAASAGELAVEAAVGLAAMLEEARLEGLFVEDANLVRLGGLPFASEVSALTGAARNLALADVEQALRVEAGRLERLFAKAAERAQLPWSFAVARGELLVEAVARAADLTVVGGPEGALAAARRAGAARRGAARKVAALFDAGPIAMRALAAAARLAEGADKELTVLVASDDPERRAAAGSQVRAWLASRGASGAIVTLAGGPQTLAHQLRSQRADVLVHPAPGLAASARALEALVAELRCLLVIVR